MVHEVEALPCVTGHHVEIGLDRLNLFFIVEVELQHGVARELVVVGVGCGTVAVVAVPGLRCVGINVGKRFAFDHVVAKVEVKVKIGKEVESVVDLDVAGRRP